MDAQAIEQAYEPFVSAVRGGGFRAPGPDEGWSAAMIAAHVTLNNDHWTRAARRLLAEGSAAYDNETAVAAEILLDHVAAVGEGAGLVADLERSVRDLAVAYDELGATGEQEIPVRIVHEGRIVTDGPAPLADMIVGNATYHLQMHYEQLLALHDEVG